IRGAHDGPADRLHARDAGALFDHAGTKALHLGIVAPRLAFGKEHVAAATRQHAENAKDDGAYKIPTHSPRHASRMRWFLLTFLQSRQRCGTVREAGEDPLFPSIGLLSVDALVQEGAWGSTVLLPTRFP